MKVQCLCGHENHVEMPFDDPRTVRIACTNACRAARQLKLSMTPISVAGKLSDVFAQSPVQPRVIGMLGH